MKLQTPKSEIAIVLIAFDRIQSVRRLWESLLHADYASDRVDVIISIDHSGRDDVKNFALNAQWPFGEKKVISHKKRMGLKAHVISCGELTETYENICVLEDDLFVSPGFYLYAKAAIQGVLNLASIAGISLYRHQWNPYVNRPFTPIEDRHDVFLMQIASSWGQIWNRKSWQDFMLWMANRVDADLHSEALPREVSAWSGKSWLKYHNAYLAETGQYFVYPRKSLTTNFSDKGEHANVTTTYQVELLWDTPETYRFPKNLDDSVKYDPFFEFIGLSEVLGLKENEISVSFYGNKHRSSRFRLTLENLPYKKIRSFGMKLRPMELNVIFQIPGSGIFLYDTEAPCVLTREPFFREKIFIYQLKTEEKKTMLFSSIYLYAIALKRVWGKKMGKK